MQTDQGGPAAWKRLRHIPASALRPSPCLKPGSPPLPQPEGLILLLCATRAHQDLKASQGPPGPAVSEEGGRGAVDMRVPDPAHLSLVRQLPEGCIVLCGDRVPEGEDPKEAR